MNRSFFAIAIVLIILILDQGSKVWIKTTMHLYEENVIFDWFRIHFIENKGMAFGLEFGGSYGKLLLSLFRIVAVFVIGYIIKQLISKKVSYGLILGMAMIMAGALGNIIDSVIYGVIFSESTHREVAHLIMDAPKWNQIFYGQVVDMLHFPMFRGHWPEFLPWLGGKPFEFFRPVFNLADSAITGGILYLLMFHRDYFSQTEEKEIKDNEKDQVENLEETNITTDIGESSSLDIDVDPSN